MGSCPVAGTDPAGLATIELAAGERAALRPGAMATIGSHVIGLNPRNQVTARLRMPPLARAVSFASVLEGTADKRDFNNKIVILAYDGPHGETLATPYGPMGAHRYFVNILRAIYDADVD